MGRIVAARNSPRKARRAPATDWTKNPFDLLLHLPSGYRDQQNVYSRDKKVELTCLEARILSVAQVGQGRKHLLCKAQGLKDGAQIVLRFFNFNKSTLKWLKGLDEVTISGNASANENVLEFIHPRISDPAKATSKAVVASYPKVEGVSDAGIRAMVRRALATADLSDTIPADVLRRNKLPTLRETLRIHHMPTSAEVEHLFSGAHPASMHLKFSEWLAYQLLMRRTYKANKLLQAPVIEDTGIERQIVGNLPFALTAGQEKVLDAIKADLANPTPMRRLLHGDVGSGKTIVAGLACAMAAGNEKLAVFMAPTELLAEQHYATLRPLLEPVGIKSEILTGSTKRAKRDEILGSMQSSGRMILFGTHALFQEKIELPRMGLAIIDEQHRFGIKQRNSLLKKGMCPHQLMLSATPIPRTLSLGLFSDLDVSALDEKPPGRMPIRTKIFRDNKRERILKLIDKELDGQVYWVCPLILDSEKQDLVSAQALFELVCEDFPGIKSGLIHGKMSATDKAAVLAKFKAGEIRMVVATTVVEVGIDAPEADVMVIEHAERMGLSQMHQLRGRVGRGGRAGDCLLLYSKNLSPEASQRLKIMRDTNDGFVIAHEDLKMRGLGEWLGLRQSGMKLRFIDPLRDSELVEKARSAAEEMISSGDPGIGAHLSRWLGVGGRPPSGESV